MDLRIGGIEEGKTALLAILEKDQPAVALSDTDGLDVAGAQVLAAAVLTARAAGRPLSVSMPEGGEARALWHALALDAICNPDASAPEAAA
ncbi:hypothetical protein [Mesobacterium pallidum]|uniref:hypothetical protein n=1 Tax=Mesobacterium pallidum TaxID=2872037 RepID=UPI001EE36641|nr:hypothetical protein [Mesobacterium pallidum]